MALNLAAIIFGNSASAAAPRVVASIKPVQSLVAGVMAGVGAPDLLVRGGASPHSYALRPSDARSLDSAAVIFWIGPALESFLVRPLANQTHARVTALAAAPGMKLLPGRVGGLWEDDHDHAEAGENIDPHVWLDVGNAKAMVREIAGVLSAADAADAAAYQANATDMISRLDELDARLSAELAPVKTVPFIVFHDAYHYMETRYGLAAAGAITVSPDRPPGTRRVAEIKARIQTGAIACVFAEPQFTPRLIDLLIEGTTAKAAVLDPEGAALDPGPGLYFTLMKNLGDGLAGCLRRSPSDR